MKQNHKDVLKWTVLDFVDLFFDTEHRLFFKFDWNGLAGDFELWSHSKTVLSWNILLYLGNAEAILDAHIALHKDV